LEGYSRRIQNPTGDLNKTTQTHHHCPSGDLLQDIPAMSVLMLKKRRLGKPVLRQQRLAGYSE
jgi:hypothetical protein